MGLKEIQILFDNAYATYYTGSKVAGRLVLNLDSPKKVREIKVKFKGEAEVKWSELETRKDAEGKEVREYVDYTAEETYFENKFILAGEGEIPADIHNYDFSTILPPILPSSYEGEFGHIRYTAKVTLDRPWKFNQECKAAFTVICPVDLNFVQEARMPVRLEKEKHVGMCCCKSGPLSASLSAPLSGFTPGQTIPLVIDLENGTNADVTEGSVVLRKIVTYKCKRPVQQTKVEKVEIAKVALSAVGAHGTNSWTENILVPALPATNAHSCSIIAIEYELKLSTSMAGIFYRGIEVCAPITIGTVPLMNWGAPGPSPAPPGPGEANPPIGWTADPASKGIYPDLPPPSFEESAFGKATTIQDKDDNEHTVGVGGWVPRYPTFNYTPPAPSAPPAQ